MRKIIPENHRITQKHRIPGWKLPQGSYDPTFPGDSIV